MYELGVSSVTDTRVDAVLGGGHVGTYSVRVVKSGAGESIPSSPSANVFKYVIKVNSVSPSSGAVLGGTLLIITGENFCAASIFDNNVFVSNGRENVMCNIVSATSTQITCLTGPADPEFKLETDLSVVVQGKLMEEAECTVPGTCIFKYSEVGMPSFTEPSQSAVSEFEAGKLYYIRGSGLDQGKLNVLLQQSTDSNNNKEVAAVVHNATTASFVFPALPAGVYNGLVHVLGKGYAGIFSAKVTFKVFSVQIVQNENSALLTVSKAGSEIAILGNGFDNSNGDLLVYLTSASNKCLISSFTPDKIFCRTPKFVSQGDYSIIVSQ